MNTEKLNGIKEIRLVLNETRKQIPLMAVGSTERDMLEEAAYEMEELILKLVNEDIKELAEDLKTTQKRMSALAKKVAKANADIKDISVKFEKVAKIVGALVTIVLTAGSVGLL